MGGSRTHRIISLQPSAVPLGYISTAKTSGIEPEPET